MIKYLDYYKPRKISDDQFKEDIYEKINEMITEINCLFDLIKSTRLEQEGYSK